MPDICMCKGEGCFYREDCYRFRAKPSRYMQAYSTFDSIEHPKGTRCQYYYSVATISYFNLRRAVGDATPRPRRVAYRVYNRTTMTTRRRIGRISYVNHRLSPVPANFAVDRIFEFTHR